MRAGATLILMLGLAAAPAAAATFTVNESGAARDGVLGDGVCATATLGGCSMHQFSRPVVADHRGQCGDDGR